MTSLSIPVPRSPADDFAGSLEPAVQGAGVVSLFVQARACLHDAEQAASPQERFAAAHLAAQRAATAVVTARAGAREGARPASVWQLLPKAAPELREWAEFFASGTDRRALAQAGIPGISLREANDLLLRAGAFVDVVGRSLPGVCR